MESFGRLLVMGDATRDERTPGAEAIGSTQTHIAETAVEWAQIRRVRLTVVEGPAAGLAREVAAPRVTIGSHQLNDLVIDDPTVSRFHCEIRLEPAGAVVVDLKSKNGTVVDGVTVREALLRHGSQLQLGRPVIRFE